MMGNPMIMVNLVMVVSISRMDTVVFFFGAEVTSVAWSDVIVHDRHRKVGSNTSRKVMFVGCCVLVF